MLNISAEALKAGHQNIFFVCVEHVLRVEDRWRIESVGQHCWVLLNRLIGEDVV